MYMCVLFEMGLLVFIRFLMISDYKWLRIIYNVFGINEKLGLSYEEYFVFGSRS